MSRRPKPRSHQSFSASPESGGRSYQAAGDQEINEYHYHGVSLQAVVAKARSHPRVTAVAVVVAGAVLAVWLTDAGDTDKSTGATAGAVAPTTAPLSGKAAAPAPSPSPSSSSTPSASRPAPLPSGPFPVVVGNEDLGVYQVIDFDVPAGVVQRVADDEWNGQPKTKKVKADLLHTNPVWGTVEVNSGAGRTAGVLLKDRPETRESCLEAARSGGFTQARIHYGNKGTIEEAGIAVGNSICLITDENLLVQARITKITFTAQDFTSTGPMALEVTRWGPAA